YIYEGRPQVVPIGFRFSGGSLYSFTTEGQKTRAMRENNAVCVLFDEVESRTKWRSVVVNGRFREIIGEAKQSAIANMMATQPSWWEPAYIRTITQTGEDRPLKPFYFRIDIESATGHETAH